MTANIIFMGSPEFAVPTLKHLAEQYHISGVVTQPDRPAGRGRVLTPPPVKLAALSLGIEVIQPERLRSPEAFEILESWKPDLIIVAAYGQILRQVVLDLPHFGCLNVHASLLPRWRGAAPIQAALLNGAEKTGVSIMKMDAGIDTGSVLAQEDLQIDPQDNALTLGQRLALKGADLLIKTLPAYLSGLITPMQQDNSLSSYAKMLKKEEGLLNFTSPAWVLVNKIRAFYPWPGAYTIWNNDILKIHKAGVFQENTLIGARKIINGYPAIGTGDGWLILDEVQPAGKKAMAGKIFLQGARNWSGS